MSQEYYYYDDGYGGGSSSSHNQGTSSGGNGKGKEVSPNGSSSSSTRSGSSYSDSSGASSTMSCNEDCELCEGSGYCREAVFGNLAVSWLTCRTCRGERRVLVPFNCGHNTNTAPCPWCRQSLVCDGCGGRGTNRYELPARIGWRTVPCPNRVPKKDPDRRGRAGKRKPSRKDTRDSNRDKRDDDHHHHHHRRDDYYDDRRG